jgi:hypothetical protein
MEWLDLLAQTMPSSILGVILFYLCQQAADKQRAAYQEQVSRLTDLLESVLERDLDKINAFLANQNEDFWTPKN